MKMAEFSETIKRKMASWLREGISPRRLALTLALGFAIGCIPVIGVPTVLCAALALGLRLNLPAIQAANYAAMPFQVALIVPFVRFGGWLLSTGPHSAQNASGLLHPALWRSPLTFLSQAGSLAGHALLAWLVIAIPTVLVMTATLTLLLRRVPALAAMETNS
jgi:uncharacterized protein (DUF2062 family)